MTKRLGSVVALALAVLACDSRAERGQGVPVHLVTGPARCYTMGITGPLVEDEVYGTAVIPTIEFLGRSPIAWPPGFTAERVGDVLRVFDATGELIAETGKSYEVKGGYEGSAFLACGVVEPR